MHVLVVDDVAVVRMVIARALKRAGYLVSEAASGAEAMERLAAQGTDILIVDIWMPGMGGIDLIGLALAKHPRVAIIAMSGGSPRAPMQDSLKTAEAAGAVITLMKPVDKNELLAAVETAVRRKKGIAS